MNRLIWYKILKREHRLSLPVFSYRVCLLCISGPILKLGLGYKRECLPLAVLNTLKSLMSFNLFLTLVHSILSFSLPIKATYSYVTLVKWHTAINVIAGRFHLHSGVSNDAGSHEKAASCKVAKIDTEWNGFPSHCHLANMPCIYPSGTGKDHRHHCEDGTTLRILNT